MKKRNVFFGVGFVLGGICFSIAIYVFGTFFFRDSVIVMLTRESLIKEKKPLEIEDGEHIIVITRKPREASELSIDCDTIHLTNLSGEARIEDNLLRPNQKAIIKFMVKNNGGRANNVEVSWDKSQLPKGLELNRIQEPIAELVKLGDESYKVEVMPRNMKAQNIVLEFYPIEKTVGAGAKQGSKGPVCEFAFIVAE